MSQKRALITGASEGIGREFALQLSKEGYQITAVARNEARLRELEKDLGPGYKYVIADLGSPQGVQATVSELKSQHYDLLVNNAGFAVSGKFFETLLEKQQQMIDVNIKALVSLAHTFLIQAQSGDALINLSSGLAFLPMPSIGLYAATKALVTSFSESLWYEQKPRGVYVMGLCPGITDTRFNNNAGGGDIKAPRMMIQTAQQVVSKALHELKARRRPTVSSGVLNTFLGFTTRFRSRKSVVSQMGGIAV